MKPIFPVFTINRRVLLSTLAALPALSGTLPAAFAQPQTAPPDGALVAEGEVVIASNIGSSRARGGR